MAPETATVTADSSPSEILSSLNPKQKAEWRQTGALPDLPEAPPKTEVAESSPAAKETPETKVETPASETSAAPVVAKEEHKPNKGAEARIKELLADNKRLAAELESARKIPVVAPAKVEEVAKPRRNDVELKTGQPMYASDEAFEEAMEKYLVAKVTADVNKANAKAAQEARVAAQNEIVQKRWLNSVKIATEKHSDWREVVKVDEKGRFQDETLKSIKIGSVMDGWILDSEIGADMLYFLAKNPGEVERIQALAPFAAARELTKLEDKLLSGTETPAPPKKEEKAEGSTTAVTRAPAPATTISGRTTAPADPVERAEKNGDFKAYKSAANAEEFAKRKAS
jgi:hypothetical protein